jgi:hypothetical protein
MRKDESMDERFEKENCVYTPSQVHPCTKKNRSKLRMKIWIDR